MFSRRNVLFTTLAGIAGGTLLGDRRSVAAEAPPSPPPRSRGRAQPAPLVTPNGAALAHRMENGVKVFHLTAEPVKREFVDGFTVNAWGYNGITPGPTIEAFEGDRVRIYVTNQLPEGTSIHWHGVILPNGMDGVSGLNQPKIAPGETYAYEFTLEQNGTLMYHPHFDEMVQIAMGMHGFFVIHPRDPGPRRVDRDFAILLNEWSIKPGTATPDPTVMLDFNLFTFNSRVFPGTAALPVALGDRVRIRLANLSMNSHPIHLHGHKFYVTGTDAGPIQASAWVPENTVNVPVGATRDIEFVADNPGDWALHCHKTHHTMNQMGHGLPNLLGVDPGNAEARANRVVPGTMLMGTTGMGDMAEHQAAMPMTRNSIAMRGGEGPFGPIEMGGMFTIVKVRAGYSGNQDPGWYDHPEGTVAAKVPELSSPPALPGNAGHSGPREP